MYRNNNYITDNQVSIMNYETLLFRICDVYIPQCNTVFFYMLISVRYLIFTYIGTKNDAGPRIQRHNSGIGSSST